MRRLAFLPGALLMSLSLFAENSPTPLRAGHPRLLLTPERVHSLRAQVAGDPVLGAMMDGLRAAGESLLGQAPLERVMEEYRLLMVSREALRRLMVLGLLHQIQPDPKWVERARKEMMALAVFADWNPGHFLDVAEMAAAMALGYDAFHADLTDEERAGIRQALLRHALEPGKAGGWWSGVAHNWNPVCHGGLSLAALAVADAEPDIARAILEEARAKIPIALAAYDPDGVHHESPSYWDYGSGYFVLLAMVLDNALGGDWGISEHAGFRKSFDYRIHVEGPSGESFNYGDGNARPAALVFHPWMGQKTGRSDWAAFATRHPATIQPTAFGKDRMAALAILGWPAAATAGERPPLDFIGRGKVEMLSFRSAWDDPGARWIALRAGTLHVNHAHMDLGSFVLEAGGVRWAHDLGMETAIYARKDAWGLARDSKRWSFLRANVFSHNTLVLDGGHQNVEGHCPLLAHGTGADEAWAVYDLGPAYAGKADSVRRRVALEENRQTFRITDTLANPKVVRELRWQMATRAEVETVGDGRTVRLREKGKVLRITLESACPGAVFSVEDLRPGTPEENPNAGFRLLVLRWPAPLTDPAVVDIRLALEP